jgi:hypothetical protein
MEERVAVREDSIVIIEEKGMMMGGVESVKQGKLVSAMQCG